MQTRTRTAIDAELAARRHAGTIDYWHLTAIEHVEAVMDRLIDAHARHATLAQQDIDPLVRDLHAAWSALVDGSRR
jgi:hypothetical protein